MHKLFQMMAAVYTYVCPRCRQILQFDTYKGIPKCPKCGISMNKK